jgi:hypothetical protein
VFEISFTGDSGGGFFAVCLSAYADSYTYPYWSDASARGGVGPWSVDAYGRSMFSSNCDAITYDPALFKPFVFGVPQRFGASFGASASASISSEAQVGLGWSHGSGEWVLMTDNPADPLNNPLPGTVSFRVVVIPEPSTAMIELAGLAALLLYRYWRRPERLYTHSIGPERSMALLKPAGE